MDKDNLDDIVIVAVELLNEIKVFDASVLNPINFIMLSVLEYALKKSNNNNTLRLWLMKVEAKLGLTSKFTGVASQVKFEEEGAGLNENFVKFGASKFSHYLEFGTMKELDLTNQRYEKYFYDQQQSNKNSLVQGFKKRDFDGLNGYMQQGELLENSFFNTVVKMMSL